jgi:nucleoredoxin
LLANVYKHLKNENKKIEIIYISSDKSQQEFDDNFAEMPWLAIPFDNPGIEVIKKKYSIYGIPNLLVVK